MDSRTIDPKLWRPPSLNMNLVKIGANAYKSTTVEHGYNEFIGTVENYTLRALITVLGMELIDTNRTAGMIRFIRVSLHNMSLYVKWKWSILSHLIELKYLNLIY